MSKRKLRAVGPDDTPTIPDTISDAVEVGTSRDVHAAMRRKLARQLDEGQISSNAISSAYKELRELDRLIRLADDEMEQSADVVRHRRTFNATAI